MLDKMFRDRLGMSDEELQSGIRLIGQRRSRAAPGSPEAMMLPKDVPYERAAMMVALDDCMARDPDTIIGVTENGDLDAVEKVVYRSALLAAMAMSVPVLWRRDLWEAGKTGMSIFMGEKLDLTKFDPPNQWWFPDIDYMLADSAKEAMQLPHPEMAWAVHSTVVTNGSHPESRSIVEKHRKYYDDFQEKIRQRSSNKNFHFTFPGGIQVTMIFAREQPEAKSVWEGTSVGCFRVGTYTISPDKPISYPQDAELVALAHFMHEPITTVQKFRGSRAERRRGESSGHNPVETQVVCLRRPESAGSGAGKGGVDWACQWGVSGHWRRQWLPSQETHRPTYIHSYIKGPADKPFKTPSSKFFMVRR